MRRFAQRPQDGPERSERVGSGRYPALQIDWTRCDGHGLCRALLPDAISLDEWGFPVLPTSAVPPAAVRDVRRAVAACPALALRLTD